MAVTVQWADHADAARVVDALLTAARLEEKVGRTLLGRRYTQLADDIGDALDAAIPEPSGWRTHNPHRTVRRGQP